MKRSKIDKVAAVAKIEELRSARDLGEIQKSRQQKHEQLEQLLQFKCDYEAMLAEVGEKGLAARQLQDYRQFLGKLDQAIEQQGKDIEATDDSLQEVRAQWISKSQRTSALDHLVDQAHRDKLQARDKAEQKEADENTLARTFLNIKH